MALIELGAPDRNVVGVRTWQRKVTLAAADDEISIVIPRGAGHILALALSGVESMVPIVGTAAVPTGVDVLYTETVAATSWRLPEFTRIPARADLGRPSILVVRPALQGSPTLPATVTVQIETAERGALDDETAEALVTAAAYTDAAIAASLDDLEEILFLAYAFDTATSPTAPATPAAGAFRLNHATPSSATGAYLNETDSDGVNRGPEIGTWALNYATAPSVLTLRSRTTPTKFAKYYVSGATTDSGTYDRLVLTYIDGNGGAFTAAEAVAVFFTPAPSIAVGYQPLDADLTSIAGLTSAADKGLYASGAGTWALFDLPAAARTFLASFATAITFAANVAMSGFKVTGLGQWSAAGDAARFEIFGGGALPTAGTQFVATNCTMVTAVSGDRGRVLQVTSTTATPRLSGEYVPGTKIRCSLHALTLGIGGSVPAAGGACVIIRRSSDGKFGSFGFNVSGAGITPLSWTNKDNYLALKTSSAGVYPKEAWLEFGSDGAGNIVAGVSMDGTNYTQVFTATEASFFGSGGAPDGVGRGVFSQSTIGLYGAQSQREVVT